MIRFVNINSMLLLVSIFLGLNLSANIGQFWNKGVVSKVGYVYAHGLYAGEVQAARLCPKFIASTGEEVHCDNGIHIIPASQLKACKFPEIKLKEAFLKTGWPDAIIKQGLDRIIQRVVSYKNKQHYNFKFKSTNPAVSLHTHSIIPSKLSFAQIDDINTLQSTMETVESDRIVLAGQSRGAAATVTTLGHMCEQNSPIAPKISAVVFECGFDKVKNVLKCRFRLSDKRKKRINNRLTKVTKYKTDGASPIKSISKITRKDIPFFLVTSRADKSVPMSCTVNIARALKDAGFETYLLVLDKSSHPGYATEYEDEKRLYERTVHAFYKKHGLPHNKSLAEAGYRDLEACRL